ncbi:MAG: TetR/AcrR family transcriptional regulator [Rhizobiales bacterium]|nr:TetR/AcrR family transcriptional regulator [Hyphomicrobiales bacterium]
MAPEWTDVDLPGVTPSRQKRSRETTAALLKAGAEMLKTRSLDDLSIEDLCARVDATVGAFYSRFDSKEAYFGALLTLAARDGESMLAAMAANEDLRVLDLRELCAQLVGQIAEWMRKHEGVLRAALQRSDARPSRWTPFKALARQTVDGAEPLLLRAMGGRSTVRRQAIGFGLQVVLGTLVNAVLNDPGPLSLGDKELVARLSGCLVLLLEAEAGTASQPPVKKLRRPKQQRR